jgi:hypothetical protein
MLKNEDSSLMLLSKLDNALADEMGYVLISMLNLVPEIYVVLYFFSNDASLFSVACNTS